MRILKRNKIRKNKDIIELASHFMKRKNAVYFLNILKYGYLKCELCGLPVLLSHGRCRYQHKKVVEFKRTLTKKEQRKYRSSIDHIYPKSKGGTNELINLQIAHRVCNELKGDNYNAK